MKTPISDPQDELENSIQGVTDILGPISRGLKNVSLERNIEN